MGLEQNNIVIPKSKTSLLFVKAYLSESFTVIACPYLIHFMKHHRLWFHFHFISSLLLLYCLFIVKNFIKHVLRYILEIFTHCILWCLLHRKESMHFNLIYLISIGRKLISKNTSCILSS